MRLKAVFEGNSFVGIFAKTSEKITIVPKNSPEKFVRICGEAFGTRVARASVDSSELLGIFCCMNSRGIALPEFVSKEEAEEFRALGLEVLVVRDRHTALGMNVAANDRVAIVNPRITAANARKIGECLGVEVLRRKIGPYETAGASCVLTNGGFLLHNSAGDELDKLEKELGMRGGIGTANMGNAFVGTCVIANSNGYVVGEHTSGFETIRLDEALGFI
ncbi:MAG: translation initiation factor IF-6 [Candidatus Micrarchaeota archaeon]|nr:translation initiation factor IF-6 [Candidatus Micrarchaeota archaeon]